jgi:predicted aldo/keto reductase-like oxidoreductase
MDNINQVIENTSVLKNLNLTEEDNKNIESIRKLLGNRFCRRCEYCMPCPVNINIPMNFLLEGYYTRYNLKDWAKERYKDLPVKPSECVKCGKCESKCPYDLPIREMLEDVYNKLG